MYIIIYNNVLFIYNQEVRTWNSKLSVISEWATVFYFLIWLGWQFINC